MNINSVNNSIMFGGFFSFLKPSKKGTKSPAPNEREYSSETARRADENLKKKLTDHKTLMIDFHTGYIKDAKTGKVFTGKILVDADKFEHIHDIRNGVTIGGMVRLKKSGQKQWACYGNHTKFYKLKIPFEEAKNETFKMIEADNLAESQMRDNFNTLGEDSIIN